MRHSIVRGPWGWLWVWFALTLLVAAMHRGGGELVIDLESTAAGNAQVYLDRGRGFNEDDSIVRPFASGRNVIVFAIPEGRVDAFRFDPSTGDIPAIVRSARLVQGTGPAQAIDLAVATPVNLQQEPAAEGFRLVPTPGTNDPQMVFAQALDVVAGSRWIPAATLAAGATLLLALLHALAAARTSLRGFVAALVLIAAAMALMLAVGSGPRVYDHPDEYSHLMVLRFYLEHGLLPPAVTDPRAGPSISIWGFSYLFETDVFYPLTALLLKLAGHGETSLLPDVRLFNVFLLVVLAMAALRSRAMAVAGAVVLLSPQIWYVYSYYSADALPLTLALLLVGLAADDDGAVARCLRGEPYSKRGIALFVGVAALLLCSKRNYLPVFPIVGMWLAVRYAGFRLAESVLGIAGLALVGYGTLLSAPMIGPAIEGGTLPRRLGLLVLAAAAVSWLLQVRRTSALRGPFVRLLLIGGLCVAVAAPRHLWDFWQNGSPAAKAAAMMEVAERTAGNGFKPSQVQSPERRPEIALVRNGAGMRDLLGKWRWAQMSLHSAYGYYGFMSMPAPLWTVGILSGLTLLGFLLGVLALRTAEPQRWPALTVLVAGGAMLIAESSLLHSWINAFNPQGRYLFPALVLLALPAVAAHRHLHRTAYRAVLAAATLVSAWSFVFVAFAAFMAL